MTWLRTYPLVAGCCLWSALALAPLAGAQTKPAAVLDNPVAALSLDQLSATRERPLFSPSRRAPNPPVVFVPPPPLQPPAAPPNLQLYGTIINADEALAIVFSSSTNRAARVRVGDEIGGWRVDKIEERKVVISLDERTAVFTMFAGKPVENPSAEASVEDQTGQTNQDEQQEQPEPTPGPRMLPSRINPHAQ
jgi:hypothetical protein